MATFAIGGGVGVVVTVGVGVLLGSGVPDDSTEGDADGLTLGVGVGGITTVDRDQAGNVIELRTINCGARLIGRAHQGAGTLAALAGMPKA